MGERVSGIVTLVLIIALGVWFFDARSEQAANAPPPTTVVPTTTTAPMSTCPEGWLCLDRPLPASAPLPRRPDPAPTWANCEDRKDPQGRDDCYYERDRAFWEWEQRNPEPWTDPGAMYEGSDGSECYADPRIGCN